MKLTPLAEFTPASSDRTWASIPHPTLPLLATPSSDKSVRVYSLQDFTRHSDLENGHKRSVRSVAWKPNLPANSLSLVTGSFDATAGVWRRDEGRIREIQRGKDLEIDVVGNDGDDEEDEAHDWEFSLVLEGHDSEIKSVAFSSSGQYLATCSRDKSVWIWEEIGEEGEDDWETVAVLQEHEGDVKAVSWCPDEGEGDVLASASYDDTVRLWREDTEGDWASVAVLKGHQGTVWALDWESPVKLPEGQEQDWSKPKKPLRLITCSADATIKVWKKVMPADLQALPQSNGIPSTMRPTSQDETWVVESTLPKVHDRAIYSVSWSKKTGRVVSTGSDSKVVIYEEQPLGSASPTPTSDALPTAGQTAPATEWRVLTTLELAHGPYEVNHATWCPRFDGGRKGEEEMVVTTADDGVVKAWVVEE
jgi:WD40 repeat protein